MNRLMLQAPLLPAALALCLACGSTEKDPPRPDLRRDASGKTDAPRDARRFSDGRRDARRDAPRDIARPGDSRRTDRGAPARPAWLYTAGGPGDDYARHASLAANGDVYVLGEFSGTVDFGGKSLTSKGGLDIFVLRLSSVGKLVWVTGLGGPNDDYAGYQYHGTRQIMADPGGGAYVWAALSGFHQITIAGKACGGPTVFRVDAAGNLLWARGTQPLYASGAARAASGNLVAAGRDATSNCLLIGDPSDDCRASFMAISPSGGTLWWTRLPKGSTTIYGLAGAATDPWGNHYGWGPDFGLGYGGFFHKLDAAHRLHCSAGPTFSASRSISGPLAVTPAGDVVIFGDAGGFGLASFNGQCVLKQLSSATSCTGTAHGVVGAEIGVDAWGNIYFTGRVVGDTCTLGKTRIKGTSASGMSAPLFAIADPKTLAPVRVEEVGSIETYMIGDDLHLAVDRSGHVVLANGFQGTVSFGATKRTSRGKHDIFVWHRGVLAASATTDAGPPPLPDLGAPNDS